MNSWSEQFGIKYPECKGTGQCCHTASPSTPSTKLLEKAKNGDNFARDFFSIFTPYKSIAEAKKVNQKSVERSINHCSKSDSQIKPEDLVFYHCNYLSKDNRCLIYEDRPQLCRDYPDSPFIVFAPGCAFEEWGKECKQRYKALKQELESLKQQKKELEDLRYQQKSIKALYFIQKFKKYHRLMVLFPDLCIISPAKSWLFPFIRQR